MPQLQPEINDQFEKVTSTTSNHTTNSTTTSSKKPETLEEIDENNEIFDEEPDTAINKSVTDVANVKENVVSKIYRKIKIQMTKLIETPKVNTVIRNIGTCVVNGFMEIVSFYFPAPLIPLIASAAGMIIPFEPVVMLRRRMPVTSYRRAFKTAVNGFMNTFNAYKFDNHDEDPYMTRRFNRRFMNDAAKDETTRANDLENNLSKKSMEND
ncbi:uncharacterized protein LOC123878148 isoform X2 [Maniola jurtina]|uniref:uncharacterized protein LOC123878148 isoform X2 n=1 Tax=Maniola jurtina TaxID=191418 RepID=UPI001E68B041|nr:uncharacterized protein LOC123878148 isoform X2 [Maniola jurtina]